MRIKCLLLLCFLFIGIGAFAQVSVSGKVIDESGLELSGVNIAVKGTRTGALTGIDGLFSINDIPGGKNAVLVFSFIGFQTQEVNVGNSKFINVQMREDAEQLDEVVVVAYGTARKKDLTGSLTAIDSKVIGLQSTSSVTKALEGAVAGLQVSAIDGQPGLDMGIRVRGVGSANLNSSGALVVIDGVPSQNDNPLSAIDAQDIQSVTVLKDAASTALYGSRGANGVVLITTKMGAKGKTRISFEGRWGFNQAGPYQVKTIDKASDYYEYTWKSIYNSARYGVGGTGKPQQFTSNVQNPNMSHDEAAQFASSHLFNYVNSDTNFERNALGNWMLYDVPGAIYTTTSSGSKASATMSGAYLVNPDGKMNPNARQLFDSDEYGNELLKNSFRQQYNVSATGGSDKVDYFVSLGYLNDPSYIRNSAFDRYNGRSNVNARLFDWLKVGANVAYSYTKTQSMSTTWGTGRNAGSNEGNVFLYLNGQSPLRPLFAHGEDGNFIYNPDGSKKGHVLAGDSYSPLGPTSAALGASNILTSMDRDKQQAVLNNWNARTYAEFKFLKDFTFTVNLAFDRYDQMTTRYRNSESGPGVGIGGYSKISRGTAILNTQQLLNYSHDFKKHHVDALIGHEYNDLTFEEVVYGSAYELIPGFISAPNFVSKYVNVKGLNNPGFNEGTRRMDSYLGRANYIYDGKYYVSASIRRDGSSKFKINRWGNFWSVGGAWRISSESFMKGTENWLSNAKIRSSYGVIGNQNAIGDYSGYRIWGYGTKYTSTSAGTGTPNGNYTMGVGAFVNDALTWENTKTFDIGVDFSLINRIHGSLDYYNRLTDNTFWNQPVSYLATGQSTLQANTAAIRNRGVELELAVDIIKNKDLFWNVSLNGTHYTAVITSVPEESITNESGTWESAGEGWSASGSGNVSGVSYLRGVGKDLYNMYFYKYAGVDQKSGLPLFWHKVSAEEQKGANGTNKDKQIGDEYTTADYNDASRYELGSAIPKWIGGLTTSLQYKGFDFTAILSYQLGGKYLNVEYANGLYLNNGIGNAMSTDLLGNTWTPENTDAKYPMQFYGAKYTDGSTIDSWKYTDLALFNASYLKVKNLTLGYTVPASLLHRLDISSLRVYASVDNLCMLSAASGFDPSMSLTGGLDVGAYSYPMMRTFSLGINLSF